MSENPRVWNLHWEKPDGDSYYIGRPKGNQKNKWSNPFSHLPNSKAKHIVATRDEAVDAFEAMLERAIKNHPWLVDLIIKELGGKDLVCWCKPARCHGDILLKIANPNLTQGETSERANIGNTETEPDVAGTSTASERVVTRQVAVQQKNGI